MDIYMDSWNNNILRKMWVKDEIGTCISASNRVPIWNRIIIAYWIMFADHFQHPNRCVSGFKGIWYRSKFIRPKPFLDEDALHNRLHHKCAISMSLFHQFWVPHISHTHLVCVMCMIIGDVFIILINTCSSPINRPFCYYTFWGSVDNTGKVWWSQIVFWIYTM